MQVQSFYMFKYVTMATVVLVGVFLLHTYFLKATDTVIGDYKEDRPKKYEVSGVRSLLINIDYDKKLQKQLSIISKSK